MEVFTCECGWTWVVGKKKVFGPIYEDNQAHNAVMQSREIWQEGYSCSTSYEHVSRETESVK